VMEGYWLAQTVGYRDLGSENLLTCLRAKDGGYVSRLTSGPTEVKGSIEGLGAESARLAETVEYGDLNSDNPLVIGPEHGRQARPGHGASGGKVSQSV
jgi:hypothetical protein